MKKIILASTSPRRHELAKSMGLDFEIIPSNYKEDMTLKLDPKKLVKELAYGKAKDVAKRLNEGIIIGADTIVVYNDKILGKPKSEKDAYDMLKMLSGKTHYVYTGTAIIDLETKQEIIDLEITKVHFNELSEKEIQGYIKTGEAMDKAGAYGIQDLSSIFVKKIEGCYFNVMGFPIYNIYKNLQKLNIDIFEYERWKKRKA
ncbi:Septum formation protein Maf [uncultured archaeon]|nr:Septum formation protein Maf [uncultured archaeon]